jgi:hypothetical protein
MEKFNWKKYLKSRPNLKKNWNGPARAWIHYNIFRKIDPFKSILVRHIPNWIYYCLPKDNTKFIVSNYRLKRKILKKINQKIPLENHHIKNKELDIIYSIKYKKQILKNKQKINCIYIDERRRFGNMIIIILKSIILAKKLNCHYIYFKNPTFFKNQLPCKILSIKLTNNIKDIEKEMCLKIDPYYLKFDNYPANIYKQIKDKLLPENFKEKIIKPLQGDLVIHIRSGDIFKENIHKMYAQPPLAYYLKVIHLHKPKRVILIYEDEQNPCIKKLKRQLNTLNINTLNIKSDLPETISILLNSKSLCFGRGTFVPAIVMLSNLKETAYCYEPPFNDVKIDILTKFKKIYSLEEKNREYLTNVLLRWENTPYQRKLMIDYYSPKYNIKVYEGNTGDLK